MIKVLYFFLNVNSVIKEVHWKALHSIQQLGIKESAAIHTPQQSFRSVKKGTTIFLATISAYIAPDSGWCLYQLEWRCHENYGWKPEGNRYSEQITGWPKKLRQSCYGEQCKVILRRKNYDSLEVERQQSNSLLKERNDDDICTQPRSQGFSLALGVAMETRLICRQLTLVSV